MLKFKIACFWSPRPRQVCKLCTLSRSNSREMFDEFQDAISVLRGLGVASGSDATLRASASEPVLPPGTLRRPMRGSLSNLLVRQSGSKGGSPLSSPVRAASARGGDDEATDSCASPLASPSQPAQRRGRQRLAEEASASSSQIPTLPLMSLRSPLKCDRPDARLSEEAVARAAGVNKGRMPTKGGTGMSLSLIQGKGAAPSSAAVVRSMQRELVMGASPPLPRASS
eukprot:35299-Pleurochrysis_carterae.AAC.1